MEITLLDSYGTIIQEGDIVEFFSLNNIHCGQYRRNINVNSQKSTYESFIDFVDYDKYPPKYRGENYAEIGGDIYNVAKCEGFIYEVLYTIPKDMGGFMGNRVNFIRLFKPYYSIVTYNKECACFNPILDDVDKYWGCNIFTFIKFNGGNIKCIGRPEDYPEIVKIISQQKIL